MRSFWPARVLLAVTLFAGSLLLPPSAARALSPDLPVSADALPTWQTNGTVWGIAASAGKVVLGGNFTQISPGAGQSGSPMSVRSLAILDAATGVPDSCQLPVAFGNNSAAVYAVEAAPDGQTVFVGGTFSSIGGVAVSRLAEIDVASCRVMSFRPPSISSIVQTLAVTSDAVYLGGLFQSVAGQQRRSFAKLSRDGSLLPWVANAYGATVDQYSPTVVPDKNARGTALEVSPDGAKVVIGGDFFSVNGNDSHSIAVLDGNSGSVLRTFAASLVGNTSRTKSVASDGTNFYVGNEGFAGFDGALAFRWDNYTQVWRDNCAGAIQALLHVDGLLFQAHHHHDCSSMGMFPDGRRIYLSVTRATDTSQGHIGWLPELNDGIGEGIGPRALAMASGRGAEYLWVGGEFTRVNGVAQQSVTRFGPTDTGAPPTPGVAARTVRGGSVQVNVRTVFDRDDSDITYAVYRGSNTTTPVWTGTAVSRWWYQPQVTFEDTHVTPGTTYSYRVRAIDRAGNQSGLSATVSVTAGSGSAYAAAVLADQPRLYYRYDDPAGSWVLDSSGETTQGLQGIAQNGVTRSAQGVVPNDSSRSATFVEGQASGRPQYIWNDVLARGPGQFSLETWFRTTSTTGGAIMNYGSSQGRPRSDNGTDRVSNTVDRVIYMENSTGFVRLGARSGSSSVTLRSTRALNDGQWHHVVGTQGPSGMRLYIDGALVAQNSTTGNGTYFGSWHVGGDNLSGYPSAGSQTAQRYFDGLLDETAIYYSILSAGRVEAHYEAVTDPDTPTPDESAPSAPSGLTAALEGSNVQLGWGASSDDVGVVGYTIHRSDQNVFTPTSSNRIGEVAGATRAFLDEDRPGGDWFYRVVARDAVGNVSAASNTASVKVPIATHTQMVVVPTEDSMVAQNAPTNQYGTSNQLSSRAAGAGPLQSFIRIDMPEVPAGEELVGARLILRTSNDSTAGSADTHQVHVVDDGWDEGSITWNTRPTSTQSGVIGTLPGATGVNASYQVPLDAAALRQYAGQSMTLRISSASGSDNVRLWSAEATASYRPRLELDFSSEG